MPIPYVGRFAPSPSGPLHAGSIVAALASWLDARAQNGRWLLRIEDIDEPRCKPEHASRILRTLEALGLYWDDTVLYQSQRKPRYQEVFDELLANKQLFACSCTRQQLKEQARPGNQGESIYPGTCRAGLQQGQNGRSWRFLTPATHTPFVDGLLGAQTQCPAMQCGDFIVKRADQLFAYQLVVVIDDHDQHINHIVRGTDLLESTGRQILLQQALDYPTPRYSHIPLLLDTSGRKLSKQNGAMEIPWETQASACLNTALRALGQTEQDGSPDELLQEAIRLWNPAKIPRGGTFQSDRGMPNEDHLAN